MPTFTISSTLRTIALTEFPEVVVGAQILTLPTGDALKLRIDLSDQSLPDVYVSPSGRYSYHWDRRLTPAGTIYRHGNAPHRRWRGVATYPRHFHDGSEDNVVESRISNIPEDALREFLTFVRRRLVQGV